jgi:hypothetical protein
MNDNNALSLVIGGETKAVAHSVNGKLFVFQPVQNTFLLNLQKMRNVCAAALATGKDEEWGHKFLHSKKFNQFLAEKLQEYSVKCGMTAEYLIQWGKDAMEGKRVWYEGACSCGYVSTFNAYEFAAGQDDECESQMACRRCFLPLSVTYNQEEFKPTREQMEAYKELKSTVIPKIERVHHTFTNEEIVFASEEETNG